MGQDAVEGEVGKEWVSFFKFAVQIDEYTRTLGLAVGQMGVSICKRE